MWWWLLTLEKLLSMKRQLASPIEGQKQHTKTKKKNYSLTHTKNNHWQKPAWVTILPVVSTSKGERVVYKCSVYFVSISSKTIFSRVILSCKKFFVKPLFTQKWTFNKLHYRFFLLKEKAAFCHSWSKIFPPWEVSSSCYPICPVNFFCWMKKEAPSLFLETFKSPLKNYSVFFLSCYFFSEFILFSFYPVTFFRIYPVFFLSSYFFQNLSYFLSILLMPSKRHQWQKSH